jgi:hypothetical protein
MVTPQQTLREVIALLRNMHETSKHNHNYFAHAALRLNEHFYGHGGIFTNDTEKRKPYT